MTILEIASQRTDLRQSGANWIGKCPLPGHETDRTPSFSVNPEKGPGVFYCFGCGIGGDLFTLQSIFTGRPREDFLPKRRKANLKSLDATIAEIGVKSISIRELQRAVAVGRDEWSRLFRFADDVLVAWGLAVYPNQPRYRGSLQEYLDRVSEDAWTWLWRLGRARRLEEDAPSLILRRLAAARGQVQAVLGGLGPERPKSEYFTNPDNPL